MKAIAFIMLAAVSTANAAEIVDTAKVIDSQPVIEQQNQQTCNQVAVQGAAGQPVHSYLGAAIGSVAGGLAGNQVGNGNGRTVATALGAVFGALTGDNLGNQQQAPQTAMQTVCQNNPVTVTTGYRVRYSYNGHEGSTVTRTQPGASIQVGITAMQ